MSAVLLPWCFGQSLSVAPMGAACVLPEPPLQAGTSVYPHPITATLLISALSQWLRSHEGSGRHCLSGALQHQESLPA